MCKGRAHGIGESPGQAILDTLVVDESRKESSLATHGTGCKGQFRGRKDGRKHHLSIGWITGLNR